MARQFFGTDGIRGTVGQAPITPDFVLRLGHAVGRVLKRSHDKPLVLIGKDTRISGYMLEAALEAGFTAAGVDVLLTGPMPTPAIAYLTRAWRLQAGVVISASHNPYYDNGIKFFSASGDKLPDVKEREIEALLDEPMGCVESDKLGRAKRLDDAAGRYIEFCKSTFPSDLDLRGLKIVVDTANGAAYHIAEHVLHELGADVVTMGNTPNGYNINKEVGATAPRALRAAVIEHRADLGIALDGDADRLIMVDARGIEYDGDQLLYAIASTVHKTEPVAGVVGTLMSNLGFEQALGRLGVGFARAKVGDRYVLENMRKNGYNIGGEQSGHIIFREYMPTGDGELSAIQLMRVMKKTGEPLSVLAGRMPITPQVLLNVAADRDMKEALHESPEMEALIEECEHRLGDTGRILIRASGTEPLIRVMVEGEDAALIRELAERLAAGCEQLLK